MDNVNIVTAKWNDKHDKLEQAELKLPVEKRHSDPLEGKWKGMNENKVDGGS